MSDAATYHEDIRSAFRASLIAALPDWPEDQWEWENEPFEPTIGVPYIRERMVPASSTRPSVGVEEHVTLFAATVFLPAGEGTRDAVGVKEIIAAFPPRLSLAYDDNKALVTKVERKGLVVEAKWASIPIMVTTLGHTIVAV